LFALAGLRDSARSRFLCPSECQKVLGTSPPPTKTPPTFSSSRPLSSRGLLQPLQRFLLTTGYTTVDIYSIPPRTVRDSFCSQEAIQAVYFFCFFSPLPLRSPLCNQRHQFNEASLDFTIRPVSSGSGLEVQLLLFETKIHVDLPSSICRALRILPFCFFVAFLDSSQNLREEIPIAP